MISLLQYSHSLTSCRFLKSSRKFRTPHVSQYTADFRPLFSNSQFKIIGVYLFFCLGVFLFTVDALKAFSLMTDIQGKNTPLEIKAQKGMVCSSDKKRCTALGPVILTKGSSILKSQKLIIYFKKASSSQNEAHTSPQTIKEIEAFGDVRFFDIRGVFQTRSQYAVYKALKGHLILRGNPLLKDLNTTVFVGNQITFYEQEQMAIALGRSTIKRGDKLIQADVLRVYFTKGGEGALIFDRLEIEGNVIISTPTEIAKANRGVYRAKTQVAELFDNVVLTRIDGQLRGNYGRYDMLTGQSQLFQRSRNLNSLKRVQAILIPKMLKKKTK